MGNYYILFQSYLLSHMYVWDLFLLEFIHGQTPKLIIFRFPLHEGESHPHLFSLSQIHKLQMRNQEILVHPVTTFFELSQKTKSKMRDDLKVEKGKREKKGVKDIFWTISEYCHIKIFFKILQFFSVLINATNIKIYTNKIIFGIYLHKKYITQVFQRFL